MIPYNDRYAPHLPNYAGAAGGRIFPSAAGFHTSEIFFTDDEGVYFFATRDAPALIEKRNDELPDLEAFLEVHRSRVRKIANSRLYLPAADPHIESHNHWIANHPGSLLVIPVADVAQHNIASLCYYLQNGYCIYDDINKEPIKGLERYQHLYDSGIYLSSGSSSGPGVLRPTL